MVLFQISDYVEHNDAILLVIVPAAQAPEISSSRALKLAKEFDTDGEFLLTLLPCCVIVQTYDAQIQDGHSRDMDLHLKKSYQIWYYTLPISKFLGITYTFVSLKYA